MNGVEAIESVIIAAARQARTRFGGNNRDIAMAQMKKMTSTSESGPSVTTSPIAITIKSQTTKSGGGRRRQ